MRESKALLLNLALCTAAITAGLWTAAVQRVNHDAAWFLFLSQRVLAGDRLYVDWIELNAPFIVWAGLPVALLERIGVPPWYAWTVLVAALAAAAFVISGRLLSRFPELRRAHWPALAAALFFVPGYGFGQREHLALILILPYAAAAAVRVARRPAAPAHALALGLAASLGAALKPHFLLIPLAIEAYALAATRRPGREALGLAIGLAICAALVLAFAPEYVPMLRAHADAYERLARKSPVDLLVAITPLATLAAVVLGFVRGPGPEVRRSFGVAAAAGLAAAVLQLKGWDYHYVPGAAAAVVALGASVGLPRITRPVVWCALAAALFYSLASASHGISPARRARVEALAGALEKYRGERVLLLANSPSSAFPAALFADVVPAHRYPDMWPVRAVHGEQADSYPPLEAGDGFEQEFVRRVVDDVLKHRPAAILALGEVPPDDRHHRYIAFLARDPRFESMLTCYAERPGVAWFRLFERLPSCERPGAGARPTG